MGMTLFKIAYEILFTRRQIQVWRIAKFWDDTDKFIMHSSVI